MKPARVFPVCILVGVWLALSPAQADEAWPEACKLELQASLPFTLEHGHVRIEVQLDGVPRHFIVDTGGLLSGVSEAVATEQKLPTHGVRYDLDIKGIGGKRTERYAIADTLTIGKLKASDVNLLIAETAPGEDGVLAPDYLRNFDLEFDFAAKTLNLFRPHRCDDHVVYWGGSYTVLPIRLTEQGHIQIPVTLDGTELEAMVDTGGPGSLIGARTVAAKFDLDLGPGDVGIGGMTGGVTTASAHRFHTLALGGLTINNPPLLVTADESAWRSDYASLLLGLRELRMFRVYIAYRAHKMYLSPLAPP
jgi:predicted aspartyl protease